MKYNVKKIILFFLSLILIVSVFMLIKAQRDVAEFERKQAFIAELNKEKNSQIKDFQIITNESIISLNASIDRKLHDDVVQQAVYIAEEAIYNYRQQGDIITNATIYNISLINTGTAGLFDSVVMYNVDLRLTIQDGKNVTDKSNYMIFYNRWDEDEKGTYFVSRLTEDEINEKYSAVSHDYSDDVYIAACVNERAEFLKKTDKYNENELLDSAYKKVLKYVEFIGEEVIIHKQLCTTEDIGNIRNFTFIDNNKVKYLVSFIYFEDVDAWVYAYTGR